MSSPDWMERHRARKLERLLGASEATLPRPEPDPAGAAALAAARRGLTRPSPALRALRGVARLLSGRALVLLPLAGLLGATALLIR